MGAKKIERINLPFQTNEVWDRVIQTSKKTGIVLWETKDKQCYAVRMGQAKGVQYIAKTFVTLNTVAGNAE